MKTVIKRQLYKVLITFGIIALIVFALPARCAFEKHIYYPMKNRAAIEANRFVDCAEPAPIVRAQMKNVLLAIPHEFGAHLQTRPWGYDVVNKPFRRAFKGKSKFDTYKNPDAGYCQSDNALPFGHIRYIDFRHRPNTGIPLTLSSPNLPDIEYKIDYMELKSTNEHLNRELLEKRNSSYLLSKAKFCIDNRRFEQRIKTRNPSSEYSGFTKYSNWNFESGYTKEDPAFLNNPIIIRCGSKHNDVNRCHLETYINRDIKVLVNSFTDEEIPPIYFASFVKELDSMFRAIISNPDEAIQSIRCDET